MTITPSGRTRALLEVFHGRAVASWTLQRGHAAWICSAACGCTDGHSNDGFIDQHLFRDRRMRIPPWLIVGLGSIMLVGCATTEAELRTQTAAVLGYAPADITLSNIRSTGTNTFYIATTPKGHYACAAETGMAKVIALGLTSPPSCYKEAP